MTKNVKKLCVTALLIALGTVLSMIKIVEMPLGGTITAVSMLPILLIPIFYGVKYAALPCVLYGAIQMAIGGVFGWGLTTKILIGCIVFDYLLAFGVLCLGGAFRQKGDAGIIAGSVFAVLLRFACHIISGYVFFANFEQFSLFGGTFSGQPFLYSLAYNAFYMLPELVITVAVVVALCKTKALKSLFGMLRN